MKMDILDDLNHSGLSFTLDSFENVLVSILSTCLSHRSALRDVRVEYIHIFTVILKQIGTIKT